MVILYCYATDATDDSNLTFNKKDILYFYEFKMRCNNIILLLFIQIKIYRYIIIIQVLKYAYLKWIIISN